MLKIDLSNKSEETHFSQDINEKINNIKKEVLAKIDINNPVFNGEDTFDKHNNQLFNSRTNDLPSLASHIVENGLVSYEKSLSESYGCLIQGNLWHDDGKKDHDYYAFNVYETSEVLINFEIDDVPTNPLLEEIGIELYKYNTHYCFQVEKANITLVKNAEYFYGTPEKQYIIISNLPAGDYCIRIGCTKENIDYSYSGEVFYRSMFNTYKLFLGVVKNYKWNNKHLSTDGKISINELQYQYGAYGAIWLPDIDPFGLNPILYNDDGEPYLRNFSPDINDFYTTVPDGKKPTDVEYANSIYRNFPFNTKLLTSKIYLWDPYVMASLAYIMENYYDYFENEIEKYGYDRFLKNISINIDSYVNKINLVNLFNKVLQSLPINAPYINEAKMAINIAIKIFVSISKERIKELEHFSIEIKDKKDALERLKATIQVLKLALSLYPSEGTSFRKGICISNYVICNRRPVGTTRYEIQADFTQTDSSFGIETLEKGDEYITYEQENSFGKGTIYVLEEYGRLDKQLSYIHEKQPCEPFDKYWLHEETFTMNLKTYMEEPVVYSLHSGEYRWHSIINTDSKKRKIVIHVKGQNKNGEFQIDGGLYREIVDGYSNLTLIKKFDQTYATSSRDKTVVYEIDPSEIVYVKVNIFDNKPLKNFQSEVYYSIYEENGLYFSNYHTLTGQDFSFSCEYNNVPENNMDLLLDGFKVGTYSRFRCGYIKDSQNKEYLTLSSIYKKNQKVRKAFLEVDLERESKSGSIDLGLWSQNEGFFDKNKSVDISIYLISNNQEILYRNLLTSQIGKDKDSLKRFNIDPDITFTGLKIVVLNKIVPKNVEKTNMGRVVIDNISFIH